MWVTVPIKINYSIIKSQLVVNLNEMHGLILRFELTHYQNLCAQFI